MDRDSEDPSEYEESVHVMRGAPQIGQEYDDVSSEDEEYDPHLESKINRIRSGLQEKRHDTDFNKNNSSGNPTSGNNTTTNDHQTVIETSVSRLDAVLKRQRERFD